MVKKCVVCGDKFKPSAFRPDQRYCGEKCNSRAYLARGAHREQRRVYGRKRYAENKLEILARIRELRTLNPARARKQKRDWLKRHPEKAKVYSQQNTARIKELRAFAASIKRRKRKPEAETVPVQIGRRVEGKILGDRKNDKVSIMAARRAVSDETRLEYDTVAQYHKQFKARFLNPV